MMKTTQRKDFDHEKDTQKEKKEGVKEGCGV